MTLTRNNARLIAEELYKLLRADCMAAAQQIVKEEEDEFLDINEAAAFLKCSPKTLYNKKVQIGAYTKIGNRLRFSKQQLKKMVEMGRLKGTLS